MDTSEGIPEEIDGHKFPEKWSFKDPYVRALCEKQMKKLKPTMVHYLDYWASVKPDDVAIIEHDTGETVTWKKFSQASKAFAARLLEYGLRKGDFLATSLPFMKEHCYLMFGCMRIGVILAALDLRLTAREINRNFDRIKPKMYLFLGNTSVKDFRPTIKEVMKVHCKKLRPRTGSVETWVQFQKEEDGVIEGAIHAKTFANRIAASYLWNHFKEYFGYGVHWYNSQVSPDDGSCVIFTTGSTGPSKAALLSHRSILLQNLAFYLAFFLPADLELKKEGKGETFSVLVNLPPSHVGGLTEQFYTAVMGGAISVLLHVFDARKSLEAVQKHKICAIGQIPACFNLQWALEDYDDFDLSSIRMGGYGGQSVSKEFILKMTEMCKKPATAYGLTEVAGVCTFTPYDSTAEEIMQSLGYDTPCCKVTVREPMNDENKPGKVLEVGKVGEICCEGPMVFSGYIGMPEISKKSICYDEDGTKIYYTGDLGSYDDKGLRFYSRRKFVLKPKGYQVFPSEVEDVFSGAFEDQIQFIGCVGVEHKLFSQGIVAVLKLSEDVSKEDLTVEQLKEVAKKELAAFKRPALFVFVDEFPLNRTRKTDYLEISKIAEEHVKKLRIEGGWDSSGKKE